MMKILISEQQLNNITEDLLTEGLFNPKYKCTGGFSSAAEVAIDTENIPPIFVRTALAVLGRESNFGSIKREGSIPLPSRYAIKAAPEYVYNLLTKNEKIADILGNIMKKVKGKENWVPSMGIAQMTPDVAKKYGVNLTELMTKTGSLVAAASYLKDIYSQLDHFDTNKPSMIATKGGIVANPNSTRNARLDATIISYNLGASKLRSRYCVTNDPNLLGPCNLKQYKPYPASNPNMVLTVDQSRWVKNYLPNFKTGKITSHGYLKEVSETMRRFTCI